MHSVEEMHRENAELRRTIEKLQAGLQASSFDLDMANAQVQQLAAIVESSEDAIIGCTLSGHVTIWNRGAEQLFGYTAEEIVGKPTTTNARLHWPDELKAMKRVRQGEHVPPFETVHGRKDGTQVHVSVRISPIKDENGRIAGASAIFRDVSERKRLEEQSRQSQKMEAFGQLAGGVAHDFNNLLTIISGYSDMLLTSVRSDDPAKGPLTEIRKAGERAASLTGQLLAFSRKQVLEERVLDLNAIVSDVDKMLRRLIGEDITLTTALAPALERVKADAGQIEQIIMNLAVNARDAMPQGGKLTIETGNVTLDESYAQGRPEVKPGRFVMLAVSDTGCGMTEEVKGRVFEPFFTTKGPEKGTGLGLATVYGIVKQSGGNVYVYSEPGLGTTFKIYLPRVEGRIPTGKTLAYLNTTSQGKETILLVEDEGALREFARYALQTFGYTVLAASNGPEAISIFEQHQGTIHLLVSDVVMPEMGGRQVAERLSAMKPGLKVLYLSGYTDDAVVRHGVLAAETAFLQKPFTSGRLASKVREVLDQESPALLTIE